MGLLKEALGQMFGGGKASRASGQSPGKKVGGKQAAAPSAKEQALAQVRAAQGTVVTADRAELIRQAMQIRQAKQQILADLSDDQRARLAALAIRGLLNEGKDEPKS